MRHEPLRIGAPREMNAAGGSGMALLRKLTGEQRRTVRHWAMELVVVIAGVLIALWVQEWAERRRATRDMGAAEEAIHAEVRGVLTQLIWREVISQCHIDRAEKLKNMLLAGRSEWPGITENALLRIDLSQATGVQTVVPGVYQRPYDVPTMAAWNSALATGALAPMDRERFGRLVELYSQIEYLRANREREDRAASILSGLSLPQQITPETRTHMLQALYEVDTARFMFRYAGASPLAELMQKLGWDDKAEIDRWIAEDQADEAWRRNSWRPCVQPHRNPFDKAR
jgi:hypothetical protein